MPLIWSYVISKARGNMDKRRLSKLEQKGQIQYAELFRCIKQGMYYDELSPSLQAQYKDYKGYDEISAIVTINHFVFGRDLDDYHIPLEFNPRPPTPEEYQRNLDEIERYLFSNGTA